VDRSEKGHLAWGKKKVEKEKKSVKKVRRGGPVRDEKF